MRNTLVVLLMQVLLAMPAAAVQPDERLKDPALEARARNLSEGFRCLVCQNQSIDESDAPLAKDLRLIIRERLRAGDSDTQVTDFLVARYGEFVLLRPRLSSTTLVLWAMPFLVLGMGGVYLLSRRGKWAVAEASERPLSDEERAKLASLRVGENS